MTRLSLPWSTNLVFYLILIFGFRKLSYQKSYIKRNKNINIEHLIYLICIHQLRHSIFEGVRRVISI